MEGSRFQILKGDQDKEEAMSNYFGTVFTLKPFLDEELDPNNKPANLLYFRLLAF